MLLYLLNQLNKKQRVFCKVLLATFILQFLVIILLFVSSSFYSFYFNTILVNLNSDSSKSNVKPVLYLGAQRSTINTSATSIVNNNSRVVIENNGPRKNKSTELNKKPSVKQAQPKNNKKTSNSKKDIKSKKETISISKVETKTSAQQVKAEIKTQQKTKTKASKTKISPIKETKKTEIAPKAVVKEKTSSVKAELTINKQDLQSKQDLKKDKVKRDRVKKENNKIIEAKSKAKIIKKQEEKLKTPIKSSPKEIKPSEVEKKKEQDISLKDINLEDPIVENSIVNQDLNQQTSEVKTDQEQESFIAVDMVNQGSSFLNYQEYSQKYANIIKDEIYKHWRRPKGLHNFTGLQVKFYINKKGRAERLEVVKSSGNRSVDQSLKVAIYKSLFAKELSGKQITSSY